MTSAQQPNDLTIADKQISLICSTGRTGTRFLGLNAHKLVTGCCSAHEPDVIMGFTASELRKALKFGLYNTVFGRLLGATGLRNIATLYAKGHLSAKHAAHRIRRQRTRIYAECTEPLYIESYPQWTLLLPVLPLVFTHYRVAALVRHPFDYIGSMTDHVSVKDRHWLGLTEIRPLRRRLFRKLTPEDVGYERSNRVQQQSAWYLAWEWQHWANAILDACDRDPNVRVFRYEDVFAAESTKRQELLSFIAHDPGRVAPEATQTTIFEQVQNAAPKTAARDVSRWPDALRREILRLCTSAATRLGYTLDSDIAT
jgi:hypothetical protein